MQINGVNYTVGADPEVFVGRDGKFVSAHGMVQGDKRTPFKVDKGAVQVDGMALEFNIDPAENAEEFQENLEHVQKQLRSMIGDCEFLPETSVHFDEDFLKNVPHENTVLGCEPDFNAYTLETNPRPSANSLMRTAGGHVHVGGFFNSQPTSFDHLFAGGMVAKALDQTLGLYSLFWDYDDDRRAMYGQAGCLRPKPYGMEYRTLSNRWVFKPELVRFVFDGVADAMEKLSSGNYVDNPEIPHIINTNDRGNSLFRNDSKVEYLKKLVGV